MINCLDIHSIKSYSERVHLPQFIISYNIAFFFQLIWFRIVVLPDTAEYQYLTWNFYLSDFQNPFNTGKSVTITTQS